MTASTHNANRLYGRAAAPGQGAPDNGVARRRALAESRVSLDDGRIAQGLVVCAVLVALCVAHVGLRFQTLDMKVQSRQLQDRRRMLMQEELKLATANQALADSSRVKRTATHGMKLRETVAADKATVRIPKALVARYAPAKSPAGAATPNLAAAETGFAATVARVFDPASGAVAAPATAPLRFPAPASGLPAVRVDHPSSRRSVTPIE